MILEGIYRRFQALRVAKGPLDLRMTFTESMAVEQVGPAGMEMTRAGRRMHLAYNGSVPTGIAPVQAFPTTAAQWAIWNGDSAAHYFFTALGALLLSGTEGLGAQLLACLFNTPVQIGPSATGLAVANGSFGGRASKAVVKSGVVITDPVAPLWIPIAEKATAAATVGPGSSIINRLLEGRAGLPPKMGLGLAVLAPAGTTPLYLPIAEWIEQETDGE